MILAMAEMYVQGVSTGKVTAIVEGLCGLEVTSTQVSRAAAEFDEQLDAWRNQPICQITYLMPDARYEKIRHDGAIRSCALLTAIGIGTHGKRSVLGGSVQLSEAEPHWRKLLESLQKRGMHGEKLIISDDHAGLPGRPSVRYGWGALAAVPVPHDPQRNGARAQGSNAFGGRP